MPGYIEDRWLTKKKDPVTGKRKRTARYGKGMRYRVAGIPGIADRSFELESDAKTWLSTSQTDVSRGTFADPRDGLITLSEYITTVWLEGKGGTEKSSRNVRHQLNHIHNFVGHLSLIHIDAAVVRKFIVQLDKVAKLANTYAHSICSTLRNILDVAVDDKRIAQNPARSKSVVFPSKKIKEKREAWAAAVVRRVLAAISPRHRLSVVLGTGCGLRQGEVFGLAEEDFDFEQHVIHVRRQVQMINNKIFYKLPKGEKTRVVPMAPSVEAEARDHMAKFPPVAVELPWGESTAPETQTHRLVMTTVNGAANNFNTWNLRTWKPALVKAGVIPAPPSGARRGTFKMPRKFGFHVTRHTYASTVLQGGEDIVTLSHWLGHETPTITFEHYAHFMPQSGKKGADAVDRMMGYVPPAAPAAPPALKLPRFSPEHIWKPYPHHKPAGQAVRVGGTARVSPLLTRAVVAGRATPARMTTRSRLVDSASVSNHTGDTALSTYL
ncbi:site-specific integrase [Streptosporangium nondiastaticum]|uniref:Site-specific integrase n=1 Tax=Streptosporangium nondiastaticum TaxID=35764 RepID=A0A9X7JTX0_9ACTN|nr:site-specific integrase [Streptosporangium nondiastaticum]PSJ29579.1 site-specific integrase [Streptosporangium nondiastaticum]